MDNSETNTGEVLGVKVQLQADLQLQADQPCSYFVDTALKQTQSKTEI